MKKIKIKLLFAWYDLWVGAFWSSKSRKLYILPLPMIGLEIFIPPKCKSCKSKRRLHSELQKDGTLKYLCFDCNSGDIGYPKANEI